MNRHCCPHCGGDLEPLSPESELADMVKRIRAFCHTHGLSPAADDSLTESEAARVLGRSKSTLKNDRLNGGHRRYFRDYHGWVRYWIADLADELLTESTAFNPH